jgi:hypothetical protein
MKYYSFLLVALALWASSLPALAQQPAETIPANSPLLADWDQVPTIAIPDDKSGSLMLVAKKSDRVLLNFLQAKPEGGYEAKTGVYTFPKSNLAYGWDLLGGIGFDGHFVILLSNQAKTLFTALLLGPGGQQIAAETMIDLRKTKTEFVQLAVTATAEGPRLHLLHSDKLNRLRVETALPTQLHAASTVYDLSARPWALNALMLSAEPTGFHKTVRQYGAYTCQPGTPAYIGDMTAGLKVYPVGHRLCLTSDLVGISTVMAEFDPMVTNEVSLTHKPHAHLSGIDRQANSLRWGSFLFQYSVSEAGYGLQVRDLVADSVVRQWVFSATDEPIVLSNGPVMQFGGGTTLSQDRELVLSSVQQYARKCSRMQAYIMAQAEPSGHVHLLFGGWKRQEADASPLSVGAGIVLDFSVFGMSWDKVICHHLMLQPPGFQHDALAVPTLPFDADAMNQRLAQEEASQVGAVFTYWKEGSQYFGYYHARDKQYKIFRI